MMHMELQGSAHVMELGSRALTAQMMPTIEMQVSTSSCVTYAQIFDGSLVSVPPLAIGIMPQAFSAILTQPLARSTRGSGLHKY